MSTSQLFHVALIKKQIFLFVSSIDSLIIKQKKSLILYHPFDETGIQPCFKFFILLDLNTW